MNPGVASKRVLLAVCLVASAFCPEASAQKLELKTYAGLTITGTTGTVYSVEYVTDLAQTNNSSAWRCLEFLQLPASPYLWVDKSAPATGKRFYRATEFMAPTNMVFIPPGTFLMGSPAFRESPLTAVTISHGFWMGRYEVTQGQYLAVIGSNPSFFSTNNGYGEDLSLPVERVSWKNAATYCGLLTEQERAAGRIGMGAVYRLPTEAEWEYACRAWTSTRFSYGDDLWYTNLTNYAWFYGNSGGTTHPVGQKLPNPWGLYDMHGNVWEWCQDWYGAYPGGLAVDPQGPATSASRVNRGGSLWYHLNFGDLASECRSASRWYDGPDVGQIVVGFRVVLAAGQL